MITHLDNLLRHLFIAQIDEITGDSQVRFEPPDARWRTHVSGLTGNALNVYLVDLQENRMLRSNERIREVQNGTVTETPAPNRIDCHYLITAWSPVIDSVSVEPTVDEHALLYKAIAALMNGEPLVPRQVYDPDPLPGGFPESIADAELPTVVLPAEGLPKLAEFWGTVDWRWKPGVYLIVTLPVELEAEIAGPMVTTRITEYRQAGSAETAEVHIQIGGSVLDATSLLPNGSPSPVVGAWVRLETPGGIPLQTTETSELGRFTFSGLQIGNYILRARAAGLTEATRPVGVPSSDGGYDVQLS